MEGLSSILTIEGLSSILTISGAYIPWKRNNLVSPWVVQVHQVGFSGDMFKCGLIMLWKPSSSFRKALVFVSTKLPWVTFWPLLSLWAGVGWYGLVWAVPVGWCSWFFVAQTLGQPPVRLSPCVGSSLTRPDTDSLDSSCECCVGKYKVQFNPQFDDSACHLLQLCHWYTIFIIRICSSLVWSSSFDVFGWLSSLEFLGFADINSLVKLPANEKAWLLILGIIYYKFLAFPYLEETKLPQFDVFNLARLVM